MQHSESIYRPVIYLVLVVLVQAIVLPLAFGGGFAGMWLAIYFSIGAIVLAMAILGSNAPAGSQGQIEAMLIAKVREKAIKTRWLRRFAALGDAILGLITWTSLIIHYLFLLLRKPDLMIGELKGQLRLRSGLLAGLFPPIVFMSIWLAVVPIAILLLIQPRRTAFPYSNFMATTIIVAVGLKHVLHLVGPAPMQELLRKAKAPVALSYVPIVALDLVALILCYNIILSAPASGTLSLAGFKDIYNRLNGFKDIFLLAFDRPKHLVDYSLGISGLLWFITLAKDVLNFRGYQRTTSDRCGRAFGLAICGFQAEAKAEIGNLSPESDTDVKVCAETHAVLGDYSESLRLTHLFVRRKGEDRDLNGMSNAILLGTQLLYYGQETQRLATVISFLKNKGLDSAQIILAAVTVPVQGLAEVMSEKDTQERLKAAAAYVFWEADRHQAAFEALEALETSESEDSHTENPEDSVLDADEACEVVVYLMMLGGLVDSASELKKVLAKYSTSLHNVIQSETRLSVLFSLSAILLEAANRLNLPTVDVLPLLNLSDAAFARIEINSLSEAWRKDLVDMRGRIQLIQTTPMQGGMVTAT